MLKVDLSAGGEEVFVVEIARWKKICSQQPKSRDDVQGLEEWARLVGSRFAGAMALVNGCGARIYCYADGEGDGSNHRNGGDRSDRRDHKEIQLNTCTFELTYNHKLHLTYTTVQQEQHLSTSFPEHPTFGSVSSQISHAARGATGHLLRYMGSGSPGLSSVFQSMHMNIRGKCLLG